MQRDKIIDIHAIPKASQFRMSLVVCQIVKLSLVRVLLQTSSNLCKQNENATGSNIQHFKLEP